MVLSKKEQIIGNHYSLKRKIGSGSFGEIYIAETMRTHRPVAVKLEPINAPIPQLAYESKLYSVLMGGPGIPQVRWYGSTENHNALVIDLLGKSLEDLLEMCKCKFSLKTVLMLTDQMLSIIEFIHNKNFIHRDLKPDNFMMGTGNNECILHIIDFGLSKKYRDPNTHVHVPYSEGKSLTGTARYASISALRGFEQSRRDDLESLAYVMIYLLKGSLPWMGLDASTRNEKYGKILDMKATISIDELCSGIPKEFAQFLLMVKQLHFTDRPRYAKYRALFRNLFISCGYQFDYLYDWTDMSTLTYSLSSSSFQPTALSPSHQKVEMQKRKSLQMKVVISPQQRFEKKPPAERKKNELSSNVTNGLGSRTTLPSAICFKNPSFDSFVEQIDNQKNDEDEDHTLSSSSMLMESDPDDINNCSNENNNNINNDMNDTINNGTNDKINSKTINHIKTNGDNNNNNNNNINKNIKKNINKNISNNEKVEKDKNNKNDKNDKNDKNKYKKKDKIDKIVNDNSVNSETQPLSQGSMTFSSSSSTDSFFDTVPSIINSAKEKKKEKKTDSSEMTNIIEKGEKIEEKEEITEKRDNIETDKLIASTPQRKKNLPIQETTSLKKKISQPVKKDGDQQPATTPRKRKVVIRKQPL